MIINPTNEAFLRAVSRASLAAKRKNAARYNLAVVPTVAGYSARVIDCGEQDPHRLKIVASVSSLEIDEAILLGLGAVPKQAGKPVVLKIEANGEGFYWIALAKDGEPTEEPNDFFARV